ncbi:MAG: DoxX family protein [Bacteroidia bacterium]|nr:DoxX family protein [Bacteroidia bacterium]
MMNIPEINWVGFFSSTFLAIVFLQSGLDKVINYKRELGWIQQKFVKNALYHYVSSLFLVLTFFELLSGALSLGGVIHLLTSKDPYVAMWGAWFSSLTMLMLIFGQRVTKDYSGAATLVPYFIASLIGLYSLSA